MFVWLVFGAARMRGGVTYTIRPIQKRDAASLSPRQLSPPESVKETTIVEWEPERSRNGEMFLFITVGAE